MNEVTVGLLVGALFILIGLVGGGFTVREIQIPVVPNWTRVASIFAGILFIGLPLVYSNFAGGSDNSIGDRPFTTTPPLASATVSAPPTGNVAAEAISTPTATPVPPAVPPSPVVVGSTSVLPDPIDFIDISGQWYSGSDGFMEFSRESPLALGYSFKEYDGNSVIGVGTAHLEERTLYVDYAHNNFIGEYSGELQVSDNEMTGFLDASGKKIPVTLIGTPLTVPTFQTQAVVGTTPSSQSSLDISGPWHEASGGYVEFSRLGAIGGAYTFKEYSPQGSIIGEGSGFLEGTTLTIFKYAHNNFIGEYSGVLRISGNQLTGMVKKKRGTETPVFLTRRN